MSEDHSYPTPPADRRDIQAQLNYLSELTKYLFGFSLSTNTVANLRRFFASVGPANLEDLVGAIVLECWEVHHSKKTLNEREFIRVADKLRQRLRRERKAFPTDKTHITPSRELPPEEEVMLVLREFQTLLESSSPEEAIVFQRYYLDGKRDISALAEELGMSSATIYRRLIKIRNRFLARREALEPPHWAD